MGQGQNLGFERGREAIAAPAPGPVVEAGDAVLIEALAPAGQRRRTEREAVAQRGVRLAVGDAENHAGPLDQPGGERARARQGLEFRALGGRERQRMLV